MENIEYWQYWRTLIFMSNINIKAIKIFIFTFFSNESVKLLHIMGGELSLTASKVAHNNNDAKFHRTAKYAQIHEYIYIWYVLHLHPFKSIVAVNISK